MGSLYQKVTCSDWLGGVDKSIKEGKMSAAIIARASSPAKTPAVQTWRMTPAQVMNVTSVA